MLLGIDLGTTHSKVGVYAKDGSLLASVKELTPRTKSLAGFEHFPPEALWQNTAKLIRQAVEKAGVEIEALALASMGEAGVPLDKNGQATYAIIPWNDHRTVAQMHCLAEKLAPERWFEITGLFPNPIHSIAKWLWLKENEVQAWEKTRLWLSVMGYVRFKLTGEAVMELSQAARTMAYDVQRNAWSQELLTLAGLDTSFLPPLVTAKTLTGFVKPEVATLTSLKAGIPVFAGGHDHICAALACGALSPEIALDSHGTAEGLTLGLPGTSNPAKAGGFGTGPHVIEGYSYLLGGVYSAGAAVQWVKNLLNLKSFAELHNLAASVEPASSPLFLPHFNGAAPPFNDPDANGAFIDVKSDHGPLHFARAVYEGIVFELKRGIEALEHTTKQPVEIVRMVGGSAGDPMWSKIRAAILCRPLELARHPDMVTMGAALLAGIGAGIYSSPQEAIELSYQSRRTFEPNPIWQELYEDVYSRYKRAVAALRESRTEG